MQDWVLFSVNLSMVLVKRNYLHHLQTLLMNHHHHSNLLPLLHLLNHHSSLILPSHSYRIQLLNVSHPDQRKNSIMKYHILFSGGHIASKMGLFRPYITIQTISAFSDFNFSKGLKLDFFFFEFHILSTQNNMKSHKMYTDYEEKKRKTKI